jgi:hypothetical protein
VLLGTGPVVLGPAPTSTRPTSSATTPPADRRQSTGRYALGLALLALALVAAVAVVGLLASDGGGGTGSATPPGSARASARLSFAPVVLERYPVGVTVTTATVSVTTDGRTGRAHVRLPTFHCLAATAPADPAAAGCLPSVTEYADLAGPALRMSQEGRGLLLSGRFPTYVRPSGSAPVYTGHGYELTVAITPRDRRARGSTAADGHLTLDGETVRSTGTDQDVLRRGR